MTPQEKAVTKAMRRHQREGGHRDTRIHCACGWMTQDATNGTEWASIRDAQLKSFERHVTKQILEAASPAAADGHLIDLNVAIKGSKGDANVNIAVSGTDSIAVACLALHTVGQSEYVEAIYRGFEAPDGWEEA